MSAAPAKLAGLHNKGAIEIGRDADLVVVEPDSAISFEVSARSSAARSAGSAVVIRGQDSSDSSSLSNQSRRWAVCSA